LVEAGIEPWMDTKDLLPGQDWAFATNEAIKNADFFIACLSKQSVNKRGYLQRELRQAQELWNEKLQEDIYLIPLRLDDCELPDSLAKFQWVDVRDPMGFNRLIRAIEVGTDRKRSPSGGGSLGTAPAQLTEPKAPTQPKFFYYISRSKVDMLLPQLERKRENLSADEPLVARALRLIQKLAQSNLVMPLEERDSLEAPGFFSSKSLWRNGLFYFRTWTSDTVAYFLWRRHRDALIVLAGSPDNVIGNRVAREGLHLSSSGEAIETLGSSDILEAINAEEPTTLILGKSYGKTSKKVQYAKSTISVQASGDDHEDWPFGEGYVHATSRESALAIFCLQHLAKLPEMSVDTVFRVYSKSSSKSVTLFSDVKAEYVARRQAHPTLYTDERLKVAEEIGLETLRTIYLGSPVYTAIV
jgi:hypothetical protein